VLDRAEAAATALVAVSEVEPDSEAVSMTICVVETDPVAEVVAVACTACAVLIDPVADAVAAAWTAWAVVIVPALLRVVWARPAALSEVVLARVAVAAGPQTVDSVAVALVVA